MSFKTIGSKKVRKQTRKILEGETIWYTTENDCIKLNFICSSSVVGTVVVMRIVCLVLYFVLVQTSSCGRP